MIEREVYSKLVENFEGLGRKEDEINTFSEYLDRVREVLEEPLPDPKEMKRLTPSGLEVRQSFERLMKKLKDDIPERGNGRMVYARVRAGPEYNNFKEKAEETLETINLFTPVATSRSPSEVLKRRFCLGIFKRQKNQ